MAIRIADDIHFVIRIWEDVVYPSATLTRHFLVADDEWNPFCAIHNGSCKRTLRNVRYERETYTPADALLGVLLRSRSVPGGFLTVGFLARFVFQVKPPRCVH